MLEPPASRETSPNTFALSVQPEPKLTSVQLTIDRLVILSRRSSS